ASRPKNPERDPRKVSTDPLRTIRNSRPKLTQNNEGQAVTTHNKKVIPVLNNLLQLILNVSRTGSIDGALGFFVWLRRLAGRFTERRPSTRHRRISRSLRPIFGWKRILRRYPTILSGSKPPF